MPRRPQVSDPEEQDLNQLLELAQLQHVLSQPGLEQRHLQQADAASKLTAAIHLLGIQQQAKSESDTTAYRDRALRAAVEERNVAAKGNVRDALITHLLQRTDVSLPVIADTLRRGGDTEFADALSAAHHADVGKKAGAHLAALNLLKQRGDTNAINAYLPAVQADPDVWEQVKSQFDPGQVPVRTTAAISGTPGYFPGLSEDVGRELKYAPMGLANLGAAGFNKILVPPLNLLNSLVGAPPITQADYAPYDYEQLAKNFLKRRQQ